MASSTSFSQLAYETIRKRLLASEFLPDRRISEKALANQLGMSRTPVREAIRRLQNEGLLYQVPRSGTFVVRPDRKKLIEIYEVRMALESMFVRKAAKAMSHEDCQRLQLLCDEMLAAIKVMRDSTASVLVGDPLQRYLRADLAFHMLLLEAGGNGEAKKIVADGRVRDAVYGARTHHRTLHHVAWVWLFHARIVRAVRRRDARASQYWLRRHIRSSLRDALVAFDKRASASKPKGALPTDRNNESVDDLVRRLIAGVA